MNREQIKRLIKLIACVFLYVLSVLWVHSFKIVNDTLANWIMALVLPVFSTLVLILIAFAIYSIIERIRDYIIYGDY